MTYGVDECRACGAPMKARGPEALAQYEFMIRHGSPMPEAKWRRLGFKCPPTSLQMRKPALGCCNACVPIVVERYNKTFRLIAGLLLAVFAVFGGAVAIMTFELWM